jgi:hypothetical protein
MSSLTHGYYVRHPRASRTEAGVLDDDRAGRIGVVACSLCLRVLRGDSVWIEAEEAIRELRSFELPAPVALLPGLCTRCGDLVSARRLSDAAPAEADRALVA